MKSGDQIDTMAWLIAGPAFSDKFTADHSVQAATRSLLIRSHKSETKADEQKRECEEFNVD